MLEGLSAETFEGRAGERFGAEFEPGATTELELVEVSRLPASGIGRADPFSLVFRAPRGAQHEQRIYRLEHDELGTFELFLVPIQPDDRGPLYQAVFA
jgi:hypothetical protein